MRTSPIWDKWKRFGCVAGAAALCASMCAAVPDAEMWTTGGPDASDISVLAVNSKNPRILYAVANPTGLFRTEDGGNVWRPVGKGAPQAIISILLDPLDAQTLYVGTTGSGVFKSVAELEVAIRKSLDNHNADPKSFVLTASATAILE